MNHREFENAINPYSDETINTLVRSINDIQIVIKDIGIRLHDIEGRLKVLEQDKNSRLNGEY